VSSGILAVFKVISLKEITSADAVVDPDVYLNITYGCPACPARPGLSHLSVSRAPANLAKFDRAYQIASPAPAIRH